jgi:hypothetical protein
MSDSKLPPTLPTVVDEAGASPGWVPALGFGLFIVVALVVAAQLASSEQAADKAHEATAAVVQDGAAADAPAAPAPPNP